jgi:hypothetical protein
MKVDRRIAPVTVIRGSLNPKVGPQPWCMTDADRDHMMEGAVGGYMAGRYTKPSGEPVPLERASGAGTLPPWSAREQAAARRLRKLWFDAKIERVAPAGYPSEVCQPYTPKGEDAHPKEMVEAAIEAYRQFRDAINLAERSLSARHVHWLREVGYGEAIPVSASHYAQEALHWLADQWNVK